MTNELLYRNKHGDDILVKINRLANVVGLDIKNFQHSTAIEDAIGLVKDLDEFIVFCRKHKEGISFSTKAERLDTLTERFIEKERKKEIPEDGARHWVDNLLKKIGYVKSSIEKYIRDEKKRPFSGIIFKGERYFNSKEINALSKVGTPIEIIDSYEKRTLGGKLYHLFIDEYKKKNGLSLLEHKGKTNPVSKKIKDIAKKYEEIKWKN